MRRPPGVIALAIICFLYAGYVGGASVLMLARPIHEIEPAAKGRRTTLVLHRFGRPSLSKAPLQQNVNFGELAETRARSPG